MSVRMGGDVSVRDFLAFLGVVFIVLTIGVGILLAACPLPPQIPPSLR